MKALQVCDVLFVMKKRELAAHFIHALGPELVGLVEESMEKVGPGGRKTIEAKVVIRAIQLLELLLERTPEDKSKKEKAWYTGLHVCMEKRFLELKPFSSGALHNIPCIYKIFARRNFHYNL